jgi:hypothetical protein
VAHLDRPPFAVDHDGQRQVRAVLVGGRLRALEAAVDLPAVERDGIPEGGQQRGEGIVQVEAVAASAREDAGDGFLRADALRASALDVDVLEGDALDVRAVQSAQRVERRRPEGFRGVDAELGQIGRDPRGVAGSLRDHGPEH